MKQDGENGQNSLKDNTNVESSVTLEEAVRIIQVNERGRQGRQRAKETKDLRKKEVVTIERHTQASKGHLDQVEAAVLIQKTYVIITQSILL